MSKRSPLVCVLALLPLARGMVAVIPFYQKCIVPTFPPDPEGEGSGLLSCCAPEKRRFPSLVLQNALNYREVHVKDPLVQLTEQVVEAAILDHRLPGAPSSSEEEQDFDTAALRRRESLLPDQGQQVLDALPCALRSRIRVVKRLVDAYDSGVDELQNILRQLVRHMCFAVGSELTPDLSPMLNAFNELRTALLDHAEQLENLGRRAFGGSDGRELELGYGVRGLRPQLRHFFDGLCGEFRGEAGDPSFGVVE